MQGAPSTRRAEDDLSLARQCVAGDRRAQRALFANHKNRVHAVLYRILGSNVGIDDAIQDAFMEVFQSLPSYRGDAALGTWIHICAVRVAYAHIERRARTPRLEVVGDASNDPSPEDVAHAREATRRLYRVLEKVSPTHRIAFVLSAIEERPLKEIAELMEASVVATKVRVWRARREVEALAQEDPVLSHYVTTRKELA
jgi:RNA polymerase sigma-70 factor (ECF subfamily)